MEIGFGSEYEEKKVVVKLEKKSKFKNFLSFTHLFTKNKPLTAKEMLEKQAQQFLNTNNHEAYIKMLSQGYQPTKNQVEDFNEVINALLHVRNSNNAGILKLEKFLEAGYKLKTNNILAFILSSNANSLFYHNTDLFNSNSQFLFTSDKRIKCTNLIQQLKNVTQQPDFPDHLLKIFLSRINHKNAEYKSVLEPFKYVLQNKPELMLKNVSFQEFSIINEKLQSQRLYDYHYPILNDIVNNYYSKDINKILENTKNNYSSELVKNLTIEKIKNEQHNIKELPTEALSLIENIESIFTKIQKKKNPEQDVEQLHIILEKRIPEVLSKYLTIDPEYRKTLRNLEGKNSEELMLDSLTNLYEVFQTTYKNMNQENVHALSATNRYTKSFKQ